MEVRDMACILENLATPTKVGAQAARGCCG